MDCLVIGGTGLLGSNVVRRAAERGATVSATHRPESDALPDVTAETHTLDLHDPERVEALLDRISPDFVVNCAAMTDVDACEDEMDRANAVNGDAPGVLAGVCAARDIDFVHVSTDYVFDGRLRRPYREGDVPNPLQIYGESKLAGERAVRAAHPSPLLVRLSFVYGIHRGTDQLSGFPAWVCDRLATGSDVPLFTDRWITPTRAGRAADVILDLAAENATGTFHVSASDCHTPYSFGEQIVAQLPDASDDRLRASCSDEVDTAAPRPTYSCLETAKVERALGREEPDVATSVQSIAPSLRDYVR